jgi:lysozyme
MFPTRSTRIGLYDGLGFRQNAGRIIRVIALASLLGSLIAAATTSAALCRERQVKPDRYRYPVRGIDVSHYQGAIDWPAVAADDVAFAYVKATEGVEGRDTEFAYNWRGAERAGLRVGAYHYFIFCRSSWAQAHNFLAVAPRRADALPPAVDLEMARSCRVRLSGREMRRELDAYLDVVEAREGRRALLYVTPQFYATYRAYLPRRPLWRRSVLSKPTPASWTLWQYLSRGRVAGIRAFVDLSVSGRRGLAL